MVMSLQRSIISISSSASTDLPKALQLFSAIGLIAISLCIYKLASILHLYTRASSLSRYLGADSYALVTGASDGIGLAFSDELAARGFNVILHGRNPAKLANVQQNLRARYPARRFQVLVADASDLDVDFDGLVASIGDRPISVLINNVGGSAVKPRHSFLEHRTADQVDRDMFLNARFPTQFTRAMIPVLQKRPAALIMNILSMGSIYGAPFLSIYAGSKGFNQAFSYTLRLDMKVSLKNIEVLGVQVGVVQNQVMKKIEGLFVVSSKDMAVGALDRVGCGLPLVYGTFKHFFLACTSSFMPQAILDYFVIKVSGEVMDEINRSE